MDKPNDQYARNYVAATWALKSTPNSSSPTAKAQLTDMQERHERFLASLDEQQRREVTESCAQLEGAALRGEEAETGQVMEREKSDSGKQKVKEEKAETANETNSQEEEEEEVTTSKVALPRVTIQFCTQCKWMLRAAYFAQELLSTFSTSLGEVSLQPSTGGTFTVSITTSSTSTSPQKPSSSNKNKNKNKNNNPTTQTKLLWDRKADGGFPETKELKRRVRDVIEPGRDLGHVDRHGTFGPGTLPSKTSGNKDDAACRTNSKEGCEDCN